MKPGFTQDVVIKEDGVIIPNSTETKDSNHQATTDQEDKCLFISTTTWSRDSHELFDYEARQVHTKCYELKIAGKVFRTALEVQVVPDGRPLPVQAADFLLSIRERDGKFSVVPADRNLPVTSGAGTLIPKKLWLIVKELQSGNHQLQEADIIKLGRFKLRVKQLVKSGTSLPELRLDEGETPHSIITAEDALTMQCRICLLEGGTTEDPLLCPCQCRGSIKFVHLECLRRWINGRLSLGDESSQKASFFFKQLQCELCKSVFPSAVFLNEKRVTIVTVPKIEPPYIILENIVGTTNRGLHVVSMQAKKELKLGRGHESDVRIADVSISRYHATIRFADDQFILEDHNSKFGTLVSLRKCHSVEEAHPLAVQVGRTVLNLSLRKASCKFDEVMEVADEPISQTPETDPEDENSHDGAGDGGRHQGGGGNINNPNVNHNNMNNSYNNMNNRASGHSSFEGMVGDQATTFSGSQGRDLQQDFARLLGRQQMSMQHSCYCGGSKQHPRQHHHFDASMREQRSNKSLVHNQAAVNEPLLQQLVAYTLRNGKEALSSSPTTTGSDNLPCHAQISSSISFMEHQNGQGPEHQSNSSFSQSTQAARVSSSSSKEAGFVDTTLLSSA